MTQPIQSVMQSQPAQQEVQHQAIQQVPNAAQQITPRAALVRTYSQNKQVNQRQTVSQQQPKRQPDQQTVPQQVQQVVAVGQHLNQSIVKSTLQQSVQQPPQATSQQCQSPGATQVLQGSAATPRLKTAIAQTQQRQQSPQLVSPQIRGPRPRLLRKPATSPLSSPSPVAPNQHVAIRSTTPQAVQKRPALQDVQVKQQNGTPESSSNVVSISNVSEMPSPAESCSDSNKSQMTPKRNVSENRQLSATQSAIIINPVRQISANQQRQIQLKQSNNQSVTVPVNQANVVSQQGSILQQQTQQPVYTIQIKTAQGQPIRFVHTGNLAKQIVQKQQPQSPQQQHVYRIVTQAPLQQQCVKAQQQVQQQQQQAQHLCIKSTQQALQQQHVVQPQLSQQQQQLLQSPAAPTSGAQIQVPFVQQMATQPQIIRMQQAHPQQMQLQHILQGQQVQLHVPEQVQQQVQLQGQQQVQLQAQQQIQLQTQQQVQLQPQQQVQLQPQHQVQLQAQHQAQLQAQQQSQNQVQLQVHHQVPKQANQMQVQLQAQQHTQFQVQKPQVVQRGTPSVLVNPAQKVARMQLNHSVNVDQSQVLSPRIHNMYSGPRAQHKNIQIISTQQQGHAQQTQPPKMVVPEEQFLSALAEQISKAHPNEMPRLLQCTEEGGIKFYLQVQQPARPNPVENPQEPAPQPDNVSVFEGVTVKDQFPTGILQDCVVSESGEIVIANDSALFTVDPLEAASEVDTKQDPCDSTVPLQNHETTTVGDKECTPKLSYQNQTRRPESVQVRPGFLAVCPYCGMSSLTLSKCQRCNRTFPDNVKTVIDPKGTAAPVQQTITIPTFTGMILKNQLVLPSEKLAAKGISRPLTPLVSPSASVEVKRKRSSTPRKPRVKIPEEPEILTLSSDDEDKQEKKPSLETQPTPNGVAPEQEADPAAMEEPDSYARKHSPGVEGGGMLEQAMDGSIPYPYVLILCRTLRIGTYKAKPLERVVFSNVGLEMKVPLPSGQNVVVSIPMSDICQIMVSFSRSMPVLFISLYPNGGPKVRNALRMSDTNKSFYFDPASNDETLKRITLLPEKITEDFKMTLKKIVEVNQKVLVEIGNGPANEILVKSSPCESALRPRPGVPGAEIQTIMIYPPPPSKGGISINTEDYACLGEDQFLNDVIIDFYLKYLMQSVLNEVDRERTHVFSSFFYKRLTSRPKTKGRRHPIEDDPKLSPAEKRHARVKTWTKSVDLFSKDFIIIPINENCHWFLAIICFPGQEGCLRMSDNTPIAMPKPPSSAVASAAAVAAAAAAATSAKLKVQNNVMSIGATTITPVKAPAAATITIDNGEEGSDRDEAEGDEEEMVEAQSDEEEESNGTAREKNGSKDEKVKLPNESPPVNDSSIAVSSAAARTNNVKLTQRDGVKQPSILIFDSLVGAPRYRVAATLREYLSIEYKVKKQGKVKEFSKDTIKGMLPKVPQQTNFTDCGLYLLQYVEMFFKDPIRDYHPPIKQLQNWFPEEIVTRKREFIVNLLNDLMKEQNIDPSSLPLPKLVFNYNKAQQTAEDEEAQARLTEADSEAEAEIARKQMADLQGAQAELNNASDQKMEQDDCDKEETEPPSAESSVLISSSEVVSESSASSNAQLVTVVLKQPLVPYPESSDDSNEGSVVKRSQCEESGEVTERKKRKAE